MNLPFLTKCHLTATQYLTNVSAAARLQQTLACLCPQPASVSGAEAPAYTGFVCRRGRQHFQGHQNTFPYAGTVAHTWLGSFST